MEQEKTTLDQRLGTTSPLSVVETPIKYCLYARKSTEDDERQALSIDSQIKEMLEIAERQGLEVIEIKKESHSAKQSGTRPILNQMIEEIRQGIYQGIFTWAPDRLSRNAGDLGILVDLIDDGHLKEIRTHGQNFTNSPNDKFLLMILCSQAKLENDCKSENVKRGLRAKCSMGWRPGRPPLGYLHDKYADKGKRKVLLDPKRSPIIKQMFEKVAYNQWSGRKILRWMIEKDNFKTRNDKRMTLSMVYRMLNETFYYGEFEYPRGSDKWYKGGHEPIITKTLFLKSREQLEQNNVERHDCKEFAFTKLMKCGLCGSGISADEKFKKLSDGSVKRYVYYGCTRARDLNCKCGYIREEELIRQLAEILDKVDIDELGIKKQFEQEVGRYYKFSRNVLKIDEKMSKRQKEIDMRNYAKYLLKEGSILEKRELLANLQSKLVMKNKKIILEK